jgi:PAS domain S-box-containing protein
MSQHEESSRDQTAWFRVVLDSIGDAVIVTDARGGITFMNPAAEALTGWSGADGAGRPFTDVFRIVNEQTPQAVRDPVSEVLATGMPIGPANHSLLLARDGTERPLEDRAAPIRDDGGNVVGVVLVFRDASERRRAERAAAHARAYAEGIVETIREPLVVLDANLRVRTANRSFYQTFRATPHETEGRFLYDLGNRQWDIPPLRTLLEEVLPQNSHFNDFEVTHEFAGIGPKTMLLNARRLQQEDGRRELILLAVVDVTERRRAAHALAVSETRYRRLFETAQDAILIVDAQTRRIFDANPFLTDLLGYTLDELVGKELWEIGLFQDAEANKAAFRTLQERAYIRYEDLPLRTKDGRQIDVEFVSNVYQVDSTSVIQCNIRDITERKHAEAGLREAHDQLEARVADRTAKLARANASLTAEIERRKQAETARQELFRQLATAQEDERRRIARELHDQLGQHVVALSLGLKYLEDGTPELSPSRHRLKDLQELTDLLGREVHHLALELRPTALDDLGLHTALMNYAEGWSGRSGIEIDFQSIGLDSERLSPAIETAVYRVVQEALTNVLKHAQARRVSVVLQRFSNQVLAVVEDDGRGFDAEALMGSAEAEGRLGLLGMQERAALVGGTLTVESTPAAGTTVIARIPLRPGGMEDGDA